MSSATQFSGLATLLRPAWNRRDLSTSEAQQSARAAFRCVRCQTIRWHYFSEPANGDGPWPMCAQSGCEDEWDCMAMMPMDEAPEMEQ